MTAAGHIVVLNGAPRSGKTSIADALRARSSRWVNLGVDSSRRAIPERWQPGIGLRPGGERPDLERVVELLYEALYESVAAQARLGHDVVVDVGHHDDYSEPLGILPRCAELLRGLPVLFVGVRCPIEAVWQRRFASWGQDVAMVDDAQRAAVGRWQEAVHQPGSYDLEVDTSVLGPAHCAGVILARLADGPPGVAFGRLAAD